MHRVGLQGVAATGGASGGGVAGGAFGGIGPGTGFGLSGPGVGLCAGGIGRGLGATCGGEGRGGVSSPAAHASSTGMGSQSGCCAELLDCLEPPGSPGRGEMVGGELAPGLSGSLDRLVGSRACRAFAGGGSAVAIFDSSRGTGTEPGFPCAREGVEGTRGGVAASAWNGTASGVYLRGSVPRRDVLSGGGLAALRGAHLRSSSGRAPDVSEGGLGASAVAALATRVVRGIRGSAANVERIPAWADTGGLGRSGIGRTHAGRCAPAAAAGGHGARLGRSSGLVLATGVCHPGTAEMSLSLVVEFACHGGACAGRTSPVHGGSLPSGTGGAGGAGHHHAELFGAGDQRGAGGIGRRRKGREGAARASHAGRHADGATAGRAGNGYPLPAAGAGASGDLGAHTLVGGSGLCRGTGQVLSRYSRDRRVRPGSRHVPDAGTRRGIGRGTAVPLLPRCQAHGTDGGRRFSGRPVGTAGIATGVLDPRTRSSRLGRCPGASRPHRPTGGAKPPGRPLAPAPVQGTPATDRARRLSHGNPSPCRHVSPALGAAVHPPVPEDAQEAVQALERYRRRWVIEAYFKVLKSGARIEERRLDHADDLRKCLAFDAITAWRVFDLDRLARAEPDRPAIRVLTREEIETLDLLLEDLGSHARKHQTPDPERQTIRQTVINIGRLAGFQPSKRQPLPGNIKLWQGYVLLKPAVRIYLLMKQKE